LSSKVYTWLFVSGDSGDWLTASSMWIVPQPYGSPLYILSGHFLNLFPGDLVIKMTIILSCLPAAVTVTLVYLITKHLTNNKNIAVISSAILLGAGVFLTQATVLEQYSLAAMFVALAYYFYLKDKKWLTALSLGLGSANHILVIPIALLWFFLERKNWRSWAKTIPLYLAVGMLPYILILWLMTLDTPPFLAGNGLSLQAINSYLGSTSVFGSLSIYDFPRRALDFVMLILMSFGLGIVPLWLAFKKPWAMHTKLLIIAIAFPIWYYLTCLDPTTWTFMTYSCPFIAVAIGIGLTKVKVRYVVKGVVVSALVLIIVNSAALNADMLAKAEPQATECYNELMSLPDGSAVVTHRGGFESMAMMYVISKGKDIVPVYFHSDDYEVDVLYGYYLDYAGDNYGLNGINTQTMVKDALDKGIDVYILIPLMDKWKPAFATEYAGLEHYRLVTGVDLGYEVAQKD